MTTYTQSQGVPIGVSPAPAYGQPMPTIIQSAPQVTVIGGCPNCRIGVMQEEFTVCGILLGILCFPIGLVCCFMMKEKRCSNCGATFN